MNKLFTLLLLPIFLLISNNLSAQDARDFSVGISAEVITVPSEMIELTLTASDSATYFTIYRKKIGTMFWGSPIAEFPASQTVYQDTDVRAGDAYEYKVFALCEYVSTIGGNPHEFHYDATGYICVGFDSPPVEPFGTVLLLIDETLELPLATEIARLENDLRAESWGVATHYVERCEEFSAQEVQNNHDIIAAEYSQNPNLSAVLLLGRVAVPYSGNIYPDGHTNHIGAWPADVFYSFTDDSRWTDTDVMNDTAARAQNHNIPGDGKFDQSILPGAAELMVGRIDFYDMPAFEDSEIELLRKYLEKDHKFRTGQMDIRDMGLVQDNFQPRKFSYTECFASSGWRNFQTFF
ncbi:MAG: hypothetical protein ACLFQX_12315, partial [Candidatus Kapaibacterium sp.]